MFLFSNQKNMSIIILKKYYAMGCWVGDCACFISLRGWKEGLIWFLFNPTRQFAGAATGWDICHWSVGVGPLFIFSLSYSLGIVYFLLETDAYVEHIASGSLVNCWSPETEKKRPKSTCEENCPSMQSWQIC